MSAKRKKSDAENTVRVTLVRSTIGRPPDQVATVRSLGLRKLHQTVEIRDSASLQGMLTKVRHLIKVSDGSGN